jgi:murein endopeptidase
MRLRWISPLALFALGSLHAHAGALPPPSAAMSAATLPRSHWVRHQIIPGERVVEIAAYYGVEVEQVLAWNELDAKRPLLRVGQRLHIFTPVRPLERRRRSYTVRSGDTWTKIASRFDVDRDKLRKEWNAGGVALKAGERIELWVVVAEPEPAEQQPQTAEPQLVATIARAGVDRTPVAVLPAATPTLAELPIVHVPETAISAGPATRGRLLHGIQLPQNDALYSIRNPDNTWGSSHAIEALQRGIADFRRGSGFERQIVIEDMSQRRGGCFPPHHSHRSGRDVDVELPLKVGVAAGTIPRAASLVDWDAAWALVKAFVATGEVHYLFLSRSRQHELYDAARRAGASDQELEEYIQYPHHGPVAFVRHSPGHVKHIHVRFKCASYETQCVD